MVKPPSRPQCSCEQHVPCGCHGDKCRLSCANDPRHGSANGYCNLHCRCDPCCGAASIAHYEQQQSAKQRPTPDHVHGTVNGYGFYGCHCKRCRAAWAEGSSQAYYRRKAGNSPVARGVQRWPTPRKK